jgi:hypothetical protein
MPRSHTEQKVLRTVAARSVGRLFAVNVSSAMPAPIRHSAHRPDSAGQLDGAKGILPGVAGEGTTTPGLPSRGADIHPRQLLRAEKDCAQTCLWFHTKESPQAVGLFVLLDDAAM